MSVYLVLMICTFLGPLLLSFDKKVTFYRNFKFIFPAIISIALPFILWDIYFTDEKIWGFEPVYLSGIYFFNLPLEECLFFLIVPFACLFIHEVLKAYFPRFKGEKLAIYFAVIFLISGISLAFIHKENWYTFTACLISSILIVWFYFIKKSSWFPNFVFTYLVALLPFLIVNGILTGAVTESPIVWYNNEHIIGIRIITIPLEDLFYNLDLLLPIVALFEFFRKKKN